MKSNGILMAISSLPSEYGIGDFGSNSKKFVSYIKKAGIKFWQLLPINPLGACNSPYSSFCSYAIDPIYIDLEELVKDGILNEVPSFNANKKRVEYDKVRNYKNKFLRDAFKNQSDLNKPAFKKFVKNNPWVDGYAKFLILLKKNDYKDWWNWEKEDCFDAYNHDVDYTNFEDEINFTKWCQFIAYKQFLALKKFANSNGIKIMGDIPYYVGANSYDSWANQDEFCLYENNTPSRVGGVPPDYFSKDGQRWGNICYDWDYMKDDNFSFWLNRIKHASELYDYLRLDHFRAFDSFWAIYPDCATAKDGNWVKAYGRDFFNLLKKEKLDIKIFAEDLGEPAKTVEILRDDFEFPGMNVIQFSLLDPNFEMKENQIIYTGTHDNDTLKGWLSSLSVDDKEKITLFFKFNKIDGKRLFDNCINYVFGSKCDYVCIPIQDYLELGSEQRMNTPGTSGSPNWEFRLTTFAQFLKKINAISELNKKYSR